MIYVQNKNGEIIEGASELGILLESLYHAWSADDLEFGSYKLFVDDQKMGELVIRESGIELRPADKYGLPLRDAMASEA